MIFVYCCVYLNFIIRNSRTFIVSGVTRQSAARGAEFYNAPHQFIKKQKKPDFTGLNFLNNAYFS